MNGCIFCKIVAGEIPATKVFEDEHALAFRDLDPKAPTHVLVIPRKHITGMTSIEPEDEATVGHLFSVAAAVAKSEGIVRSGFRAIVNSGPDAGQSVYHLHMHVIGGRAMGWPPFPGD